MIYKGPDLVYPGDIIINPQQGWIWFYSEEGNMTTHSMVQIYSNIFRLEDYVSSQLVR